MTGQATEEQEQELEALEAIFGDELVRLEDDETYEVPMVFEVGV